PDDVGDTGRSKGEVRIGRERVEGCMIDANRRRRDPRRTGRGEHRDVARVDVARDAIDVDGFPDRDRVVVVPDAEFHPERRAIVVAHELVVTEERRTGVARTTAEDPRGARTVVTPAD